MSQTCSGWKPPPYMHVRCREGCAWGRHGGVKETLLEEDSGLPTRETKHPLHLPELTEAYLPEAGNHRRVLCPGRDKGFNHAK